MAEQSAKNSSNANSEDEDFDFMANFTPEDLAEVQHLRTETASMQQQIRQLELCNEMTKKRLEFLDEEIAEKRSDYEELLEATKIGNQQVDVIVAVEKMTRELIRDLEFRVLPCSDAWSSELSRITSGAPEKTDQDRVLDNDTKTANTTVAVEDKLQIKKDLIEFAQIWKKDHVTNTSEGVEEQDKAWREKVAIPCKLTHFDIPDDSSDESMRSISPEASFNSNDLISDLMNAPDVNKPQLADSAVEAPPHSPSQPLKGKKTELAKATSRNNNDDISNGAAQSFFDSHPTNENSETFRSNDIMDSPVKNATFKVPHSREGPEQMVQRTKTVDQATAQRIEKQAKVTSRSNNNEIEGPSRSLFESSETFRTNDLTDPVKTKTVKVSSIAKAPSQSEKQPAQRPHTIGRTRANVNEAEFEAQPTPPIVQSANSSFFSLAASKQMENAGMDQSFGSFGPGAVGVGEADSFFNISAASSMTSLGMFPTAVENTTANVAVIDQREKQTAFDTSADNLNTSGDFDMDPVQSQHDADTSGFADFDFFSTDNDGGDNVDAGGFDLFGD